MSPASPSCPTPARAARRLFAFPAALLLAAALPALAQDPTVTAAVPDTTEQATYDLVVTISGTNFGADSVVDFYVTGTTDPGGITVKKVRRRNTKTLEATIDVAADAQTQYRFDIQVRTGGRTGKGTELFKVLAKVTGPDITPPAAVSDLTLVAEPTLTLDGDYVAQLTWSAPADDQGAVFEYLAQARPGSTFPPEAWETFLPHWFSSRSRPDGAPPASPGVPDVGAVRALAPETTYTVVLRSADESGNWSDFSNALTFTTGPPPLASWEREEVAPSGECWNLAPQLAFAPDGSVAVAYSRQCAGMPYQEPVHLWTPGSGWRQIDDDANLADDNVLGLDPAGNRPALLAAIGSRKGYTLQLFHWTGATWDSSEYGVIDTRPIGREWRALAFRMDAGGAWRPVVAFRAAGQGSRYLVVVAIWNGGAWEKHELPSTSDRGDVSLAIDDLGRIAVAFHDDIDHNGIPDTPRFALLDGGTWRIETVETPPDPREVYGYTLSLAWNPAAGEFWLAHQARATSDWVAHVCRPSPAGGPWSCEVIPEFAFDVALAFSDDPGDGTAWLAVPAYDQPVSHNDVGLLRIWSKDTKDPQATWTVETAEWGVTVFEAPLGIDPLTGLPVTAIEGEFHPVPSLRLLRKLP